jgi:hypothetical protein
VVEAIRRQLPPDADLDALVFTGPGGGNGVPTGTRTILSRHGIRRSTRAPHAAPAPTSLISTSAVLMIYGTPSRPGWRTPACLPG